MVARRSAALPRSLAPGRGPAATRPAGSGGIRAALRAFWRLALPVAAMAGATALNVLLAVAGPGPLLARLAALWQQAWAEPLFRTAALVALGLAASVALGHQQAVRRAALVAAAIAGAAVANVLVAALGAAVLPAPLVQPRIVLPVGAVAIMLAVVGWRARSLLRRLAMAEAERAPAAWILAQHRLEALWAVAPRAWSTLLGLLLAWLGLHLGLAALHLAAPATVPASSTWLELTVLYLAAAVWHRWPSRVAAGVAVGTLALCPLVQLWLGEAAAEQLADFVYFALWIAVLQGMWELWRERREAPHSLAPSPDATPHPPAPSPTRGEGELAHHDRGQQAPLALDGSGAAWRSRTGPGEEGEEGSVRPRQSRGGEGIPAPLSHKGRGAGGEG